MKQLAYTVLTGVLLIALATPVLAQVPMLLNYQGKLTDPSGSPKNGTFTMQFSLYDAQTGGNQLPTASPWSEAQSVTVTDGVFNVLLGSVTPLPPDLFSGGPSDSAGPLRFLQVVVGGETLSPRKRMGSAAYALSPTAGSVRQVIRGTATFAAGQSSKTISFSPAVDPSKAAVSVTRTIFEGGLGLTCSADCVVIVTNVATTQFSAQRASNKSGYAEKFAYQIVEYE